MARVAAAMNTPGLKYRSFGNLPIRAEAPRKNAAAPSPEEVLRELRATAAATREAPAERQPAGRPPAEPPSALAPIMAVPLIEGTLNPYTPPPAPRFRPLPRSALREAAPSASPPPLPPVMTAPPRPPAPRFLQATAPVANDVLDPPTIRLPRPAPVPLAAPVAAMPAPPPPAPRPAPSVIAAPAAVLSAAPPPPAPRLTRPVMAAPAAVMPAVLPPPAPSSARPVMAAPALLPQAVVAPPATGPRASTPTQVTRAPAIQPPSVVVPPPAPPTERPAEALVEPMRLFGLAAAPLPVERARPAPAAVTEPALTVFAQMFEMPQEAAPPKMAQVDWAALASPARPAQPPLAETSPFARPREAPVPPPLTPTPMPISPPAAEDDFAIFAGLGPRREPMPHAASAPAGSTLGRLKEVVTHSGQPGLPQPTPMGGTTDRLHATGRPSGASMPAAAVTVSLGEVMRLIAAGGPPAASPFDTFRTALRTHPPS